MEAFLTASSHHELYATRVAASAVGPHGYLTLPHLIRLFQEVALRNTDRLGIASSDLMQDYGLTWVLHRQLIDTERWPRLGEPITVVTVPTRIERKLITYRDFYLLDANNKIVVRSTSAWSVMHYDSRRLRHMPQNLIDLLDDLPPAQTHLSLPEQKPTAPQTATAERHFDVDFARLDFNNHLTNPAYAELMIEPLGEKFLSTHSPTHADIAYHHEARYGEKIRAVTAPLSGDHQTSFGHALLRGDTTLATMRTNWLSLPRNFAAPAAPPISEDGSGAK